jgi:hypothetical protein
LEVFQTAALHGKEERERALVVIAHRRRDSIEVFDGLHERRRAGRARRD